MKDRNIKIIDLFTGLSNEEKLKKIISLGQDLESFPKKYKKDDLLVKGCQARLWMHARKDKKGNVIFSGDTDALISKGLLALMILFYSNQSSKDILKSNPVFIEKLKLNQNLTHSRVNGLYSLQKQILYYAQAFSFLDS